MTATTENFWPIYRLLAAVQVWDGLSPNTRNPTINHATRVNEQC